jgi:protein tyrosine phosphatase (PTP) superfamily phosphohydrolase (DUF442 family)
VKSATGAQRAVPLCLFAILVLVLAAGCGGYRSETAPQPEAPEPATSGHEGLAAPDTVSDLPGFSGRIYRDGRVLIGGQPDQEALRALPQKEVVAVINLRTAKEMADTSRVDFDEAALVDSLQLAYVEIPLGGKDNPYVPAAVDSFAAAMDRYPGKVLLHCASGGRASHMWAAYLVQYEGWDVTEAYARGEAIGIGRSAFSRLLDRKMKVVESVGDQE